MLLFVACWKASKVLTEDDEPEEKVECWRNLDYNYSQNLTVCPEGTCLSKIGIHNQPLWHECWHTNQTSDLIDTGFCPCSFAEKSSTKCNFRSTKKNLNFYYVSLTLFFWRPFSQQPCMWFWRNCLQWRWNTASSLYSITSDDSILFISLFVLQGQDFRLLHQVPQSSF